MSILFKTFYFFAALLILCSTAQAKRVALVIGNDKYTNISQLQKAGNDADAIAKELKSSGFDVRLHKDLAYRPLIKAIEGFTNGISKGDEVVIFYAGHGIQLRSGPYILPIDIDASSESEVEKTAYALEDLTDKISTSTPAFSLVVIDACRDNPLKSKSRNVGGARGLGSIEPPKGQIIVYSASRGQQALDRLLEKDPNPNSVFTRELISKMKRPGIRIDELMRDVQESVETLAKSVNHEQRPAIYNESRGHFFFISPTNTQLSAATRPTSSSQLKLDDLEKEESIRKEWLSFQSRMLADFEKTNSLNVANDLKIQAWERFLSIWSQDNPLSKDDENLRTQAQARLNQLKNTQRQTETENRVVNSSNLDSKKVKFTTNAGEFVIEVYPEKAPKTVENFLQYVRDKHYDGTIFHRVIGNFMVQGGGYDQRYVERRTRSPIEHEGREALAKGGPRNTVGTIAMARTNAPNSATSQFFINVVDNAFLDPNSQQPGYTVFGKVISGMDTVQKIRNTPTSFGGPFSSDVPRTPIVIQSASML